MSSKGQQGLLAELDDHRLGSGRGTYAVSLGRAPLVHPALPSLHACNDGCAALGRNAWPARRLSLSMLGARLELQRCFG